MTEKIRTAVFDIGAHRALRRLIDGPIVSLEDLKWAEEGLRALVLHDDATIEPFLLHGLTVADAKEVGAGRQTRVPPGFSAFAFIERKDLQPGIRCIVGNTPSELYGLLRPRESEDVPDVALSPSLQRLAESESHAKPGSEAYEVYADSLKVAFGTIGEGGSAVCETKFLRQAVDLAAQFPHQLLSKLDADWASFAKNLNTAGPLVPPVLSIALTRSASRDKIPAIIRDLRDEWAGARGKVWALLDALKTVPTLAQAREIERELKQTSEYFSPINTEESSRPTRILWDVFVSGAGGTVVAAISGGNPVIGAATGAMGRAVGEIQRNPNFGQILFGRGGFDLARRVRHELSQLERNTLQSFLAKSERKTLGFPE